MSRAVKERCQNTTARAENDAKEPFPRPDSNLLHYLLIDQLPIGVFQKDMDGRFIFVNSWFCHLKEATAEDYLGKTAQEVAAAKWKKPEDAENPESRREVKLAIEGTNHHELIMRTGQSIESEEYYPDIDGKEQYLHAIKGPLIGPDGTVIGSQGLLLDITERKRAEAQLASERNLLRALLNSTTDAIYFKDRESRFLRCSAAMAPLFNVSSADQLIGKRDFDFFGEEHARLAFADEQEIIRTGQPIIGKTEKETWPDGRVTWALTSKMPLYNEYGEIIGTLGVSKNVTAFKEAEAKVEQLHKELMEASRQAGMAEVATSVLHNVGNVLNSVNVSATLLLEEAKQSKVVFLGKAVALLREHASDLASYMANDPKGQQLPGYLSMLCDHLINERQKAMSEIESVRQNIEHVKEIVAMQQNYARVSGVTESVNVTEMVEDALRMNSAALSREGVEVLREYSDGPVVTIERHKVLQILVNLISNARHACGALGRANKRITVKTSFFDQRIDIAVIDNGVGIPQDNLTRIFNHGFTTRKDGHGFGLHSGALAAREMGGTLAAYSEGPGAGATFTLVLPLSAPNGACKPNGSNAKIPDQR
jgi:PAS domain S-box-containing protein